MATSKKKKSVKKSTAARRGSTKTKTGKKKTASTRRSTSKKVSPKAKASPKKKTTAKSVGKKKRSSSARSGRASGRPAKQTGSGRSAHEEETTRPLRRESEMDDEPAMRPRSQGASSEMEDMEDEVGEDLSLEEDEESESDFLDKPDDLSHDEDTE